jgi:hypothetical protein
MVAVSFVTLMGLPLPQESTFDGPPQMCFNSVDDIYKGFATDDHQQHIHDEKILVKVGCSQSFITRERLIRINSQLKAE